MNVETARITSGASAYHRGVCPYQGVQPPVLRTAGRVFGLVRKPDLVGTKLVRQLFNVVNARLPTMEAMDMHRGRMRLRALGVLVAIFAVMAIATTPASAQSEGDYTLRLVAAPDALDSGVVDIHLEMEPGTAAVSALTFEVLWNDDDLAVTSASPKSPFVAAVNDEGSGSVGFGGWYQANAFDPGDSGGFVSDVVLATLTFRHTDGSAAVPSAAINIVDAFGVGEVNLADRFIAVPLVPTSSALTAEVGGAETAGYGFTVPLLAMLGLSLTLIAATFVQRRKEAGEPRQGPMAVATSVVALCLVGSVAIAAPADAQFDPGPTVVNIQGEYTLPPQVAALGLSSAFGDANCDGQTIINDASTVARMSVNLPVNRPVGCQIPDASGDGFFNINDAYIIARCSVNFDEASCPELSLPVPNLGETTSDPVPSFVRSGGVDRIEFVVPGSHATELEYSLTEIGESQARTVGRTFAAPGDTHAFLGPFPASSVCVRARSKMETIEPTLGDSEWSSRKCVDVPDVYEEVLDAPSMPSIQLLSAGAALDIEAQWQGNPLASGYRVEWSQNGSVVLNNPSVSGTSTTLTVASSTSEFCVRVGAKLGDDGEFDSDYSQAACLTHVEPIVEVTQIDNARPQWLNGAGLQVSHTYVNGSGPAYGVDFHWGNVPLSNNNPTDGTFGVTWADYNRRTDNREIVLGNVVEFELKFGSNIFTIPRQRDESAPFGHVGRVRTPPGPVQSIHSWAQINGIIGVQRFELVAIDSTGLRSEPLIAETRPPQLGENITLDPPMGPTEYPSTITDEVVTQVVPPGQEPVSAATAEPAQAGVAQWACSTAGFAVTPFADQVQLTWEDAPTFGYDNVSYNADLSVVEIALPYVPEPVQGTWTTTDKGLGLVFEGLEQNYIYEATVRMFSGDPWAPDFHGSCTFGFDTRRPPGMPNPTEGIVCSSLSLGQLSYDQAFIDWSPVDFVDGYYVRLVEGDFDRWDVAQTQPAVEASTTSSTGNLFGFNTPLIRDTTYTASIATRFGSTVSQPCLFTFATDDYGSEVRTIGACYGFAGGFVIEASVTGCAVMRIGEPNNVQILYGGGGALSFSYPGLSANAKKVTSNTPYLRDWAGESVCVEASVGVGASQCRSLQDGNVYFRAVVVSTSPSASVGIEALRFRRPTNYELTEGRYALCDMHPEHTPDDWC